MKQSASLQYAQEQLRIAQQQNDVVEAQRWQEKIALLQRMNDINGRRLDFKPPAQPPTE